MIHRHRFEISTEQMLQDRQLWRPSSRWSMSNLPWEARPFGREHLLPNTGLPSATPLRFSPDFLVQQRSGNFRDGSPRPPKWSVFLECKASSHECLAINEDALRGYEKWQSFTCLPVYILSTTGAPPETRKLEDYRVMPVKQILKGSYKRRHFSTWDYERNAYDNSVVSDPCVMVPKADFVWTLADLMDQLVAGRKRPTFKEAVKCS